MKDFLTIVEQEMDRQGLSMSELARRAGIGRAYLYRVLAGEQSPTLEWIEKVSNVLGITVSFRESA